MNEEERSTIEQSLIDPQKVNQAIAYASRLLGMREYSVKTLKQKILTKGYNLEEVEQAITYLLDNNWLSDKRFCEVFIRSKANRGLGQQRICFELSGKGISKSMMSESLAKLSIDWLGNCREVCFRKADSSALKNELNDRQKLYRFLQYRGFSGEQIKIAINEYFKQVGVELGEYDE